jgi:penicillin-binding protein 1A
VAEQPAIPRAVEAPPPPPPRAAPPGAPRAARTDAPARRKKRPADPRPRRPLPAWLRPRWVQWTLALGLGGALLGGGGLVMIILWFGSDLPSVRSLEIYEPPVTTVVTDADGRTLGEFFEEQRYVVPLERVPEHVRNAFVAAEDASFYEHGGLDYLGIVRAMLKNVQEGRMAQGASTITQQVARSFLLSREKKLARKIKEAILASRIERNFDKEHILYLYLNQIFLGHGAYGVQAAARLYFGKDVENLTVAEGAMIAGLPQAPSTYSPNRNWESARQRQRYVLDQMAKRGYITQGQADAAFAEPVRIVRKSDRNLDVAPFYVEHVRRYLKEKYGHDLTYKEGLQIRIPVDAELQVAANHAISEGVRGVDRRMGYRGPLQHWDGKAEIEKERLAIDHERAETLLPYDPSRPIPAGELPGELVPTLEPGERTRGIVESVDAKHAVVRVGSRRGLLSVEDWEWCHKVKPDADFRFFKCKTLDDMLFAGDLVAVEVKDGRDEKWRKLVLDELPSELRGLPRLAMDQDAWPEAALLSMRVKDGAVIAMVGGSDYEGSEFNRAVQAKRQVGSTFKPLVYTAALDAERPAFTPSSVLLDAPIVEQRGDRPDELWKPANSDAEYLGETTFRRGLLLSRNIVTLRILEAIGVKYTVEYMKRFGFDTKLEENLAMGLGASALTLHEMLRAYSVFPTLGDRREPNYILEVRDRHGKVLEARPEGALTEDVIPAETAYIMVNLMLDVVRSGTATRALQLGVPVAGKTGTTNNFRDAWFVGFTRELVTVVWVGLDEFKSMGRGQYGADLALPMWMEYMAPALKKYPPSDYEKPPGVEWVSVDSVSGLLAREGQKGIPVPYKRGSAPTGFAPEAGQMGAADFLSGEY